MATTGTIDQQPQRERVQTFNKMVDETTWMWITHNHLKDMMMKQRAPTTGQCSSPRRQIWTGGTLRTCSSTLSGTKKKKKKNWDAHHKPAEGIHSNKVGILLQQNLPSHGTFDHIVTWNADECHDYGLFWKIVIMEDSDDNFDEYARLYIEHRRRNRA